MVQRYWNYVTITLDCIQDVWAPSLAWHLLGLELCGPHGDGQCAAGWCYEWGLPWHFFLILVTDFEAFGSKGLHWFHHYIIWSPVSRGAFMSIWSCVDRFTTWYSSFKRCCSIVCTSYSPSQLYCSTQVSTIILTNFNVQWHLLHCQGSSTNRFQLYVSYIIHSYVCVFVCMWLEHVVVFDV